MKTRYCTRYIAYVEIQKVNGFVEKLQSFIHFLCELLYVVGNAA